MGGQSLQPLLRGDGDLWGSWDQGEPATSCLRPPPPLVAFLSYGLTLWVSRMPFPIHSFTSNYLTLGQGME